MYLIFKSLGTIREYLQALFFVIFRSQILPMSDDFYTTGATAKECQKELMRVKPASIGFMAFAAK